jgi:(1->4)-alpha-D-glucan 1-alpha-D-glucosylmutase
MELLLPVGEHAALAQLLLKLTCPGVPDIYQGDELWSLALVDPDNRRPVDWQGARAMLGRLREGATPDHGELKMWLIMRALALRARQGEAFEGSYTPLHAGGHVCAFLRGDAAVLVAVTLPHGLGDGRPDNLELGPQAAGTWRDLLGERDLTIGQHGVLPDSAAPPGLQGLWLLERAEAPL